MYAHGPKSAFESETFGEDLSFHVEQPVGSMSISPCGRDVVLASKEGLHVIDLDSPYSPPRYLPHRTPWEVADVQWSPFAARDFWVISTSNQKALVWNLGLKSRQDSVEFVLHGHSRAITDINFSAHHPDVLATCAVDSFVHCWDLRVPARPVVSFSDWFAGATQVKWNRQESHVIASSHDKYLRIWDDRMGASPVRSIEAHGTKIYGIDWNRHEQDRIVTCSLDRSVKFWNISNLDDVPERVINTQFPAWRARHTPFGWGLLAMPQRGDGDLHLYDRRPTQRQPESGSVPAVARFYGHKQQVKEFLWRPRGSIVDGVDHREFQLVTWGTDQELRLHRMRPEILSAVGYERGVTELLRLNVTRAGATYKTFRDEPSKDIFSELLESHTISFSSAATQAFPWRSQENATVGMRKVAILHPRGWLQGNHASPHIGMHGKTDTRRAVNPIDWMKNVKITSWNPETLGEEISQVGEKFAKVSFESVDVPRRKAVISMDAPWGTLNATVFMKIDIKFPTTYPAEAAAVFKLQKTAAMTDELAAKLSTELRNIAETYVARRRGCLEAILRYLLREQSMEQIVAWIMEESVEEPKTVDHVNLEGDVSSDEDDVGIPNFQVPSGLSTSSEIPNANVLVPVPNGCGARWSDNGKLVCFFPAKSRQPMPFLGLLGPRNNDADKSEKAFEGFGRLKTDSPGRTTLRTVTSGEDQTSDFSDGSSFSSSSSSASSDNLVSLPTQFFPRHAWRAGGAPLHRSRSTEYSTQSAIDTAKAWNGAGSSQSVVSLYDMNEFIPSKRGLAMEYIIFGKASDICDHNAAVATKLGHQDLAHIWLLMQLILQEEVQLERISRLHGSSDILTIARSAASAGRREGKGRRVDPPGRVRWGESAFGGKYLVPALIGYFERNGDVQMLAMLSCVFAEDGKAILPDHVSRQRHQDRAVQDYHPSVEVAHSVINKASTMSFATGISAAKTREADRLVYSDSTTPYSTGATPPAPARQLSRASSDTRRRSRLSGVDVPDHNLNDETSTNHPAPTPLSTSPEEPRSAHRSNSNLAFSITRASLSTLTPSFSRSPPTNGYGSEKMAKSSPVGSFVAQHMNAGGRSAASIFGGPAKGRQELGAQTTRSRRSSAHPVPTSAMIGRPQSVSFDGEALERLRSGIGSASIPNEDVSNGTGLEMKSHTKAKRRVKIKSTLHNQDMFDEDGYARVPLLDPSLDWKYRAYRARYAHLLGVWHLHIQRAEILKFGTIPDDLDMISGATVTDPLVVDDKVALENSLRRRKFDVPRKTAGPKPGPEIRRRCVQCNEVLIPIEKNGVPIGWECTRCPSLSGKKSATFSLCTICAKSIVGLMVPCLNCGHVTCFPCQRKWLARDTKTTDLTDEEPFSLSEDLAGKPCAAACGCICSSHDCVTVPTPHPSDEDEVLVEGEQQPEDYGLQFAHRDNAMISATPDPTPTYVPDSALEAMRSLSSRGRSASNRDGLRPFNSATNTNNHDYSHPAPPIKADGGTNTHSEIYAANYNRYDNIGRGFRAGLTRTAMLRERGSDATMRKRSESEARRVER